MDLFENMLILLVLACALLQVSRRLGLPYPALLALAGACVGALPWAPKVAIEPHLALALFIAPALLDSAFDTAPRELRRNWLPLLSLVVVAVVLTTATVAWLGVTLAGLPLAAAITLGAIVAPPDAVAAAAVLARFSLPRRTLTILNGESLLNDAVALLIFGAASSAAVATGGGWAGVVPELLIAAPGGAVLGIALAHLQLRLRPLVAGTLSSSIVEFVATFATWLIAEHLRLSPILALVGFAMTLGRYAPARVSPRDRVHSYSVWAAVVFLLNVMAFLLMGLQARQIVLHMGGSALSTALRFSAAVLAAVIGVRIAWVMFYGAAMRRLHPWLARHGVDAAPPSLSIGMLVSWAGMRGLVTLATAFALPGNFPQRDLIVLSAFSVVLGTLVIQGLSLAPLVKLLRIEPDGSLEEEISRARVELLDAAIAALDGQHSPAADSAREEFRAEREVAGDRDRPQGKTEQDRLRLLAIRAQRGVLEKLRDAGTIGDDTYHRLEEELDWAELHAMPSDRLQIEGA